MDIGFFLSGYHRGKMHALATIGMANRVKNWVKYSFMIYLLKKLCQLSLHFTKIGKFAAVSYSIATNFLASA